VQACVEDDRLIARDLVEFDEAAEVALPLEFAAQLAVVEADVASQEARPGAGRVVAAHDVQSSIR
jgi:hypothetical protein